MELFQALHTRRSIRKYQEQPIGEDLIHKLLAAAMMAPSAGDERPWQFILVTDGQQKERIAAVHPHAGMVRSAPLGVLLCGDLSKEKYDGFWPQDCSAAMQNLLLAAHGVAWGQSGPVSIPWKSGWPISATSSTCRPMSSPLAWPSWVGRTSSRQRASVSTQAASITTPGKGKQWHPKPSLPFFNHKQERRTPHVSPVYPLYP